MPTLCMAGPRSATLPRPNRNTDPCGSDCRLALAIAAAAFDVAPEDIRAAARRSAAVAEARHVAIYLAHIVFQLSMRTVADAFGRDRTSVGHAVRRIEDRRDEPGFEEALERLERLAIFCRGRNAEETA